MFFRESGEFFYVFCNSHQSLSTHLNIYIWLANPYKDLDFIREDLTRSIDLALEEKSPLRMMVSNK